MTRIVEPQYDTDSDAAYFPDFWSIPSRKIVPVGARHLVSFEITESYTGPSFSAALIINRRAAEPRSFINPVERQTRVKTDRGTAIAH